MKKVLFVVTKAELGGAQRYVRDLAIGAVQAGYSVVVASEPNRVLREALLQEGIAFREIASFQREIHVLKDAKIFWELFRLFRKEKPDILHLNSSKAGVAGAVAGKLAGVKNIIFTAHGWVFNEHRPSWQKQTFSAITKIVSRIQHAIICVSEFDRHRALELRIARETKLTTIHNGIDPKSLKFLARKEAREALGLGEKEFIVGTIANFYKNKSLDTLAFTAITAHRTDLKFVIIGDGPEKHKIETLIAKYKLQDRFLLPGAIVNAAQYLKAFDVFVLPSKKEGLPYALLEAMAAKLPCIVSSAGGMPEAIHNGENGIVIPHPAPGNLWDAIAAFAKNKKRARELGTRAAETIAKDFSLARMREETFKLYQ